MSDERTEFKKFIVKFLVFAAPLVAFTLLYFVADPFRVLRPYNDYYKDCHVEPDRDFVATELFLKHHQKYSYDSFVFGNSRSRAFECRDWVRYEKGASCFHFAANGEVLYGIWAKVRLIDKSGSGLKRALLVLDPITLAGTSDLKGHLYVKHPALSQRSWFSFQCIFFAAYYEDLFFVKFADYYLFHRWRPYMRGVIQEEPLLFDPVTNDDIYAPETTDPGEIERYYAERKNQFYERKASGSPPSAAVIGPEPLRMLEDIRQIFERHETRVKVVLSPLYDQVPFNPQDLKVLQDLFGKENVLDLSGVNEFTADIHNYREYIHYKPKVAREILRRIYGEPAP